MCFASNKVAAIGALLFCFAAGAQQKISPITGINWPLIALPGTPTSHGLPCSILNYGQPYQNTTPTPNIYYTCGTDGWGVRGGSSTTGTIVTSAIGSPAYFSAAADVSGANVTGLAFFVPGAAPTGLIGLTDSQCFTATPGSTFYACEPATIAWNLFHSNAYQLTNLYNYGPGSSEGNQWRLLQSVRQTTTKQASGIAQSLNTTLYCFAVGDCAGRANALYFDGGCTAGGDQCVNGDYDTVYESTPYLHGTITATTGSGDQAPVFSVQSGNHASAGLDLVDITQGTISGNLNGAGSTTAILGTYFGTLPVTGVTLPVTSAACKSTTALSWSGTPSSTLLYATIQCTLATNPISGMTPSFSTGPALIVGSQVEQTTVTAGAVVAGVQQLTFAYRHAEGTPFLFQGGPIGQVISFDANLAFSGLRSTYNAVGSWGGSDLIYAVMDQGNPTGPRIPTSGNEAETNYSAFHLYPYAEITQNQVNTSVTGTISIQLEPNNVPWTVGDLIENPHGAATTGIGYFLAQIQNSPCITNSGCGMIRSSISGYGFGSNAYAMSLSNYNPTSYYFPGGGPLSFPTMFSMGSVNGVWGNWITSRYTPPANTAMFTETSGAYPAPATCTASFPTSGHSLVVTSCASGVLSVGQTITGTNILPNSHITALPAGCGLSCTVAGTYTIDLFEPVIASETVTGSSGAYWVWNLGDAAGQFFLKREPSTGLVTLEGTAFAFPPGTTQTMTLTAAAPTVAANQVGFGGTTVAASNCGSLSGAAGCLVINVAGTTHYVPYW